MAVEKGVGQWSSPHAARWPVAFILGGLATAFWIWFVVASGVQEGLGAGDPAAHVLAPGGIFLITLLVAWRLERFGGMLFLTDRLVVATDPRSGHGQWGPGQSATFPAT